MACRDVAGVGGSVGREASGLACKIAHVRGDVSKYLNPINHSVSATRLCFCLPNTTSIISRLAGSYIAHKGLTQGCRERACVEKSKDSVFLVMSLSEVEKRESV
jgi:hypothetical protein